MIALFGTDASSRFSKTIRVLVPLVAGYTKGVELLESTIISVMGPSYAVEFWLLVTTVN